MTIHVKNLQIVDKLNVIDTSTVGGRVKYYRIINKVSAKELARLTGYSRDNIWEYEECNNFCPLDFCIAVARVLEIDLELICDEYTLFLNSNYIQRMEEVNKELGISYSKIAEKYGIPSNTFLSWLQTDYVPSRMSFNKYIKDNPLFYADKT